MYGDDDLFWLFRTGIVGKIIIWTCTEPEKVPEHFIASMALLKTVVVEGICVTTNSTHQVTHEWMIEILNLEVGGEFTLTMNRFLNQHNQGIE